MPWCCLFLIEECEGIDINATDNNLHTPLHVAYLGGHRQISEYLIKHGTDITAMDIYGHVPYEYIDSDPDVVTTYFSIHAEKMQNTPTSI